MSGKQFERQIVIWLKNQGYNQVVTTEYYDKGIDIIASNSGISLGVQVKRSNRPVGVSAIRAAVTGIASYGCSQSMVVTNSTFTAQARDLAQANHCQLIDGNALRVTARLGLKVQ